MAIDYEDILGKVFTRLTVIERGPDYITPSNGKYAAQYLCQCSCGNPTLKLVRRDSLLKQATKSCGCLSREHRKMVGNRWASLYRNKRLRVRQAIQVGSASDF